VIVPILLLVVLIFGFFTAGIASRRPWIALGAWGIYAVYEGLMYARILCTGECNIRVDLLLIWPLLLALSISALWGTWRARRKPAP
jgi:hypothetical protein